MTQVEINTYRTAASLGLIPDEENPIFIFSLTHTDLLTQLLSGAIDAETLVRHELKARGLNEQGVFIGFKS